MKNLNWREKEEKLLKEMQENGTHSMLIGYGVNVKFGNSVTVDPLLTVDCFTRLATFIDKVEAFSFYNSLVSKVDSSAVIAVAELEEIWLLHDGSYDYDQIKLTYIKKEVIDIKQPVKVFEEQMKKKYSFIYGIDYEETYEEDGKEKHRYLCWLKFPYASTDSDGGFFSFHTEKEFDYYINNSIFQWDIKKVLNDKVEYGQYSEFIPLSGYSYDFNEANRNKLKIKAIELLLEDNKND